MIIIKIILGYICINFWELIFGWVIFVEGDGVLIDGDYWRFGDCDGGWYRGWGGGGGFWIGYW